MHVRSPLAVALAALFTAGPASAQPAFVAAAPSDLAASRTPDVRSAPSSSPPASPSLRVDVGLFSPVGEIGVVYSRPVHRLAAVEAGVGYGFSGLQLSGMGKLRLGNERTTFTPGVGLSLSLPVFGASSIHTGHPPGDDERRGSAVTMAWLDADLAGIEHRTRGGLVLSASAGLTLALTEGHWDAIDLGNNLERFDALPQFRLGVGKTF